jgi:xanthine dehydrogenase accessory factor
MTHSHQLDEDICHAILSRERCGWLGLIGSGTKYLRFRQRLAARGISEDSLDQLNCPVGDAGVKGKRPATIAVAIAAQLLAEKVPEAWK